MSFLQYLKNVIVFTALLSLVAGILSFTLAEEYFVQQVWIMLVYFMLVSALFYLVLQRKQQDDPKKYIRAFLAGTTVRLFIHMIALIVFALVNRDRAIPVIIAFFLCYLFFTVFEVMMQLKKPSQAIAETPEKIKSAQ